MDNTRMNERIAMDCCDISPNDRIDLIVEEMEELVSVKLDFLQTLALKAADEFHSEGKLSNDFYGEYEEAISEVDIIEGWLRSAKKLKEHYSYRAWKQAREEVAHD